MRILAGRVVEPHRDDAGTLFERVLLGRDRVTGRRDVVVRFAGEVPAALHDEIGDDPDTSARRRNSRGRPDRGNWRRSAAPTPGRAGRRSCPASCRFARADADPAWGRPSARWSPAATAGRAARRRNRLARRGPSRRRGLRSRRFGVRRLRERRDDAGRDGRQVLCALLAGEHAEALERLLSDAPRRVAQQRLAARRSSAGPCGAQPDRRTGCARPRRGRASRPAPPPATIAVANARRNVHASCQRTVASRSRANARASRPAIRAPPAGVVPARQRGRRRGRGRSGRGRARSAPAAAPSQPTRTGRAWPACARHAASTAATRTAPAWSLEGQSNRCGFDRVLGGQEAVSVDRQRAKRNVRTRGRVL